MSCTLFRTWRNITKSWEKSNHIEKYHQIMGETKIPLQNITKSCEKSKPHGEVSESRGICSQLHCGRPRASKKTVMARIACDLLTCRWYFEGSLMNLVWKRGKTKRNSHTSNSRAFACAPVYEDTTHALDLPPNRAFWELLLGGAIFATGRNIANSWAKSTPMAKRSQNRGMYSQLHYTMILHAC